MDCHCHGKLLDGGDDEVCITVQVFYMYIYDTDSFVATRPVLKMSPIHQRNGCLGPSHQKRHPVQPHLLAERSTKA